MTTHYGPGDLVAYYSGADSDPGTQVQLAVIIREVTDAEVADLSPVYTDVVAPSYWVSGLTITQATSRSPGQPYDTATVLPGWRILTVIKAAGDSDAIAGMLT